MTPNEPQMEDVSVEEDWTPIGDEGDPWAGARTLPPPLSAPAPPQLNTHEMEWSAFEDLVMSMARRLDGAFEARRYGKPGQAQHGLDVVGFFADRNPSVYQAKRWQKFDAKDLEAAVERYEGGRRPFGADRLVIAVASEVRDRKTIEKLAALRADHPDLIIELWDRAEISERLRNQSQLVTTHFGVATAAAFCVSGPMPASPPPPSIEADAILRGPIVHLGLLDDVRRAERALGDQPEEAAMLFSAVAERLESGGFVPHAAAVRELEAQALGAAGRHADEGLARVTLGWRRLVAGDFWSVRAQLNIFSQWGSEIPPHLVRLANSLSAVFAFRTVHGITIEQVATAVDALVDGDAHRAEAVLALSEGAVIAQRAEIVSSRIELINQLAATMPADDESQMIAARLRMCVADCCGGWDELAAAARDSYPPAIAALVIARSARHLTLVPNPPAAVARWRDAIERACMTHHNGDAADWLYALRATRIEHGRFGEDINELHRHAQVLRAAGGGTIMPEGYAAHEQALEHLRSEKWPDAYEALNHYLWRSIVVASWADEIEAHDLLGDLFARTGRAYDAVTHYIAAGEGAKLETLANALRDEAVRLPIEFISPRPSERTAAFKFAATCSDLIADEDARRWCAAAFQEVKEDPQPAELGAPNPWLAAFAVFGQLADLSSEDEALEFLEMSEGLLRRDPNRYRFSDEAQVMALIGIGRAHPELRSAALDQLLRAILVDQRMAQLVLEHGGSLLRADPERVAASVGEAAQESLYAALALVIADADTTPAIPLGRRLLAAALAPRVRQPGEISVGTGFPQTAGVVSALPEEDRLDFARGMVAFAQEDQEQAHNRADALEALRAIARYLPLAARSELFDAVLPFAQGAATGGDGESELFPGANDLLRRFRVNIGSPSLAGTGLKAAAALAANDGQYSAVQQAAINLLHGADDLTLNSVAVALVDQPADAVTLPVEVLAAHPSPWLRALAAVLWVRLPSEPESIGLQLARDPSPHVRVALASGVRDAPRFTGVREILASDPRRSVRRQLLIGVNG